MRTVVPHVFGEGARTDVLVQVPPFFDEWPRIVLSVVRVSLGLVKQDEQVPVGVFAIVASSPGTVEVDAAALRQHVGCHLLDAVYHFVRFHSRTYYRCVLVSKNDANLRIYFNNPKKTNKFS